MYAVLVPVVSRESESDLGKLGLSPTLTRAKAWARCGTHQHDRLVSPLTQALVCTALDFPWMISVSPFPQRMRSRRFQRLALSYPTSRLLGRLGRLGPFPWMISVSPFLQRTRFQQGFQRPTLSYITRALRKVRPVSRRIKLRGVSIPARAAIMPSLDVNTLISVSQMAFKLRRPVLTFQTWFQRYPIGHWHMDDYTIVTF